MIGAQQPALRLLIVTARYFPYRGGIETHVFEVARRLTGKSVDVTVLTTNPGGRLQACEVVDGVRVLRARAWPDVEDYYFAPGVYRTLQHGRPRWDVVHVQGSHTFVPPLAMLGARHAHIPYVVTFHTGTHSSKVRNIGRPLQWMLLRGLFRNASRLIAVSRFEQTYFSQRMGVPAGHFEYIPNGSDLPKVAATSTQTDKTLILSVGRLERFKGHHRVIAAMPRLIDLEPSARLQILGSGPYEQPLQELARQLGVAERVEIRTIPAEDRAGMASALAAAGLVVLMSDGESHPVAVMEALAMGRPVLGAHTPGLIELAERGLLRSVPLEASPDVLARAMQEQLRNPPISANVRLPTWDDCADALLRVYAGVSGRQACVS